jgi:hypothetical protein
MQRPAELSCCLTASAPFHCSPPICSEELVQLLQLLFMPAAEQGAWMLQWAWTFYQVCSWPKQQAAPTREQAPSVALLQPWLAAV